MRKVELLEVERAALIDLVDEKIEFGEEMKTSAKNSVINLLNDSMGEPLWDAYDYWTERLHMLRQLKAKLEREEE